jgi:NAD-dependent dihydropyrimidine dehydrogenase PreA subunit
MRIKTENCENCGICVDFCNVGAIRIVDEVACIDPDVCVECWVCYRNRVCPRDCFEPTPLATEGQIFKHVLSDPTETSAGTGIPGRGTEESKTNDVTGRFGRAVYGIAIDMGRPAVGTYLRDVEKVAMAMAAVGVRFAGPSETPLAALMTDPKSGKLRDDMLDVHVQSVIIEGSCRREQIDEVLAALLSVEKEIDTVFSLGVVSMLVGDDDQPLMEALDRHGIPRPTRGKVNVGLGRPLYTG